MVNLEKYQALKTTGKSAREVYFAAKADGVGEVDTLCLLRAIFGLTIVEAKQAMTGPDPFSTPQKVEVGRRIYWEGADTVEGLWIMEAEVKRIEGGFAHLGDHKRYLVHSDGLVEASAAGALLKIPLSYFAKSLQERLQASAEFWGQLATLSKSGAPE